MMDRFIVGTRCIVLSVHQEHYAAIAAYSNQAYSYGGRSRAEGMRSSCTNITWIPGVTPQFHRTYVSHMSAYSS